MKHCLVFLLSHTLLCTFSFAQTNDNLFFEGVPLSFSISSLDSVFSEVKIFSIPTERIKAALKTKQIHNISLKIEDFEWNLDIYSAEIFPEGTSIKVDNSLSKNNYDPTFKGTTQENKPFRLTINEGFIAGFLPLGEKEYFIEPLFNFDARAPENSFIFYEKSKIRPFAPRKCIVRDVEVQSEGYKEKIIQRGLATCIEVELAVATDISMLTKYGNTTAVSNRVSSIMNLVSGLYQSSFSYQVNFKIITWFQAKTTEPWTTSNNSDNVLDSFSDWGAAGGFGVPFDLGQFWTNRDFSGSTIGIAWVSGVCNINLKYHAIQDFSSNDALMRCLVAHEIGHNFSMYHSSDIMASSVSTSTTWSATSKGEINSYLPSVISNNCLAFCITSGGNPNLAPIANFIFPEDTVCVNKQVQFEDDSKNIPNTYKWTFEGGTPNTSTIANPKVLYKTAGTYYITLTVTNFNGTNSIIKKINIATIPVPSFTNKITNLSVTFTNTTNENASWLWKFGDNKTSSEKNPTHLYAIHGNFSVILTATNLCGARSSSKLIAISAVSPSALFKADTIKGCAPLTVKFSNQSSNAQSYLWKLDGAKVSSLSAKEPIAIYDNVGNYDVQLIAFNGKLADTLLLKKAITVIPPPSAYFNTATNSSGVIKFKNQSIGADSSFWNFGDNTFSTDSLPSHFYTKSGTYIVSLMAKNKCGQTIFKDTLDILLPPISKFDIDSNYINCNLVTINPQNNASSDVSSYLWKMPFATPDSSTLKEPTITYSKSGIYEIKLIVKNASGSDTFSKKVAITVKNNPIINFEDSISLRKIWFKNKSENALGFEWDFGDSQKSMEKDPEHEYKEDGIYNVSLKGKNDCDSVIFTKLISITTLPIAGFSFKSSGLCSPITVDFEQESSSNAVSYLWRFEGGVPSESTDPNPKVTYTNKGNYSVALSVKNAKGIDSLFKKNIIAIQTKPIASFAYTVKDAEIILSNTSINGLFYTWNFGDSTTSVEANPKHLYKKPGKYSVELNVENECGSTKFAETINLSFVKSNDFLIENGYIVFPNPTTRFLTLYLKEVLRNPIYFYLTNSIGQSFLLENSSGNKENGYYYFDLNQFPKGVYFLKMNTPNEVKSMKIILE